MKSLLFVAIAIPVVMLLMPDVFGSGARMDWSDHYDDYEGAPECWVDGYDDGQNGPFNQDRHEECVFDIPRDVSRFNEPYYEAFIHGCRHAGNTDG